MVWPPASARRHFLPVVAGAVALSLITLVATAVPTRASRVTELSAQLSAEAEVPTPGPAGATGTARLLIDLYGETVAPLCFDLTIEGLAEGDAVTAAHIHAGEAGVAGDVVVPLFTEAPFGELVGCLADADLDLLAQVAANPSAFYVNIHTEAYPDGAVRGQLDFTGVPTEPAFCAVYVIEQGSVDEPTDLAFPEVGETIEVIGRFDGADEVDVVVLFGDELVSSETVLLTAPLHQFSFSRTFEAGDEGVWRVVGTTDECEAVATITVSASASPTPAPQLPDTATRTTGEAPWPVWAAAIATLTGLGAFTALRRRSLSG